MIQNISLQNITKYTECTIQLPGYEEPFVLLSVDRDSYAVGLVTHNSVNFDQKYGGLHSISIGKSCAIAESIYFMTNPNHDYSSVIQGSAEFLPPPPQDTHSVGACESFNIKRKGTIIVQNDVWIGRASTVMAGVTLHNGCVVGTGSVVTKDVPPYAIVGGNPARIIKYRFDEETINGMQKIAWWDWSLSVLEERRNDFLLAPDAFVRKYLPEAEAKLKDVKPFMSANGHKIVLFIPDLNATHPLYEHVLEEYFIKSRPNIELLVYVPKELSGKSLTDKLFDIFKKYENRDSYVTLQTGADIDERSLFLCADYFVTTRDRQTVYRSCLSDMFGTKLLYGTDYPCIPSDLI